MCHKSSVFTNKKVAGIRKEALEVQYSRKINTVCIECWEISEKWVPLAGWVPAISTCCQVSSISYSIVQ